MSEIAVLSSFATREAYLDLVPKFEAANGHTVTTTWAPTVGIMKRMADGETYDLVIMASDGIDKLTAAGNIASGSRVDLARSGIGLAIREGVARPDISSTEGVKKTLLGAEAIGYSTGPSGIYLEKMFERLGIMAEVKPKIRITTPGVPVGTMITKGEAELGLQQVSELICIPGIQYLGPLPPDLQHITVFSAGIHVAAKHAAAAKALVAFLTSPEAAPVIRHTGLEPA